LADVRAYVRRGRTRDVTGMLGKLVETAKRVCVAISTHMQREEAEVLPLLAAALGSAEQRAIVWHTLRYATSWHRGRVLKPHSHSFHIHRRQLCSAVVKAGITAWADGFSVVCQHECWGVCCLVRTESH